MQPPGVRNFIDHSVVVVSGVLIDPSYGTAFFQAGATSAHASWEAAAIEEFIMSYSPGGSLVQALWVSETFTNGGALQTILTPGWTYAP
jgi:hypothetical protein